MMKEKLFKTRLVEAFQFLPIFRTDMFVYDNILFCYIIISIAIISNFSALNYYIYHKTIITSC